MKKKILIFPCGTEIGLEIHNALKYSTHVELYGATSQFSNHGKYVYSNYIMKQLPFVYEPNFVEELNSVVSQYEIDYIYPAHDSVVLKLAEIAEQLKCKVIGSVKETCQICRSKRKTYEFFNGLMQTPRVYSESALDMLEYPLFMKPDVGEGSKGIFIAKSPEEAAFYLAKDPTLLLLELLPGKEYTVDCFTNSSGELLFIGQRERIRTSNGISVNTKRVNNTKLTDMANIINANLQLRGAWFFQAKERKNGEAVLLEIAPRIAGTMGYYRNMGVNFPLLSIFDRLNIPVKVHSHGFELNMDRALINRYEMDINYDHVYIDLDDTIIINGKINIWIMAFLFQCLNNGKQLHLLTRHAGQIPQTLKQYRLSTLFTTVTFVEPHRCKSEYITNSQSIFIDDSFSEREKVSLKCNIPTFDICSIEALLDWRM